MANAIRWASKAYHKRYDRRRADSVCRRFDALTLTLNSHGVSIYWAIDRWRKSQWPA